VAVTREILASTGKRLVNAGLGERDTESRARRRGERKGAGAIATWR
jgi:hypothetical protein